MSELNIGIVGQDRLSRRHALNLRNRILTPSSGCFLNSARSNPKQKVIRQRSQHTPQRHDVLTEALRKLFACPYRAVQPNT